MDGAVSEGMFSFTYYIFFKIFFPQHKRCAAHTMNLVISNSKQKNFDIILAYPNVMALII